MRLWPAHNHTGIMTIIIIIIVIIIIITTTTSSRAGLVHTSYKPVFPTSPAPHQQSWAHHPLDR